VKATVLAVGGDVDADRMMGPLAFVNWRVVNENFCMLMWVLAAILAVVVVLHLGGTSGDVHHAAGVVGR
jgi:hypothetical protein